MISKKTTLALAVLSPLVAYGAIIFTAPNNRPVESASATTATCPAGSYDIGISKDGSPICKLEPTGCPYGDSIPLDSPKCAPSPEELAKQKEAENVPAPTNDTRSTSGKEEQSASCSSSK